MLAPVTFDGAIAQPERSGGFGGGHGVLLQHGLYIALADIARNGHNPQGSIGPRVHRFATAASPAYLDRRGRPAHPRDLLGHACLRGRFASGSMDPWEFEREGEIVRVDPTGPLIVRAGGGTELAVDAAVAGLGVIHLVEAWLAPHLQSGALEPVLEPWWQSFSGPFLYYPGRRLVPAPLRAFIDFIKAPAGHAHR